LLVLPVALLSEHTPPALGIYLWMLPFLSFACWYLRMRQCKACGRLGKTEWVGRRFEFVGADPGKGDTFLWIFARGRPGREVRFYKCRACGHRQEVVYKIQRRVRPARR
jgi:hypothetical protein